MDAINYYTPFLPLNPTRSFQIKNIKNQDQISQIFAHLKGIPLDPSCTLAKEWNLRSRASDPRGETLRFSHLLHTLKSQINLNNYPQLKDFLETSFAKLHHSLASGHSLNSLLNQQKKELIILLTQLEVQEIESIHLNVFEIPKGFYSLVSLVQIEKKIQSLETLSNQMQDYSYDELTLDQIVVAQLSTHTKQLTEVVSLLAEIQDFDRIHKLTETYPKMKGALLGVLFDYLVQNNRLDHALKVANLVPMKGQKVALLLQLAQLYLQDKNQGAKSEEVFQEAYLYLEELTPQEKKLVSPLIEGLLNSS